MTLSFADFIKKLEIERQLSTNTLKSYVASLEHFADFLSKSYKITSWNTVSEEYIRNYFIKLLHKYKKSSVCNRISCLRSFFSFLKAQNLIGNNPCENIKLPKKDKLLPKILNRFEIEQLIDMPRFLFEKEQISEYLYLRDTFILELFYESGMRISELINVKIQDISLEKSTIRVHGKGKKDRICPVGKRSLAALKNFQLSQSNFFEFNDFLLQSPHENKKNQPISARAIQYRLKFYLKVAGLPSDITPHKLRHTYATHLLNNGADLRLIQELLGHENLSTTQIYTHVNSEAIKNAYKKSHPRA